MATCSISLGIYFSIRGKKLSFLVVTINTQVYVYVKFINRKSIESRSTPFGLGHISTSVLTKSFLILYGSLFPTHLKNK